MIDTQPAQRDSDGIWLGDWKTTMSLTRMVFDGLELRPPRDWRDISHTLDEGSPFSLAKPDGVGALQFSPAIYESGETPSIEQQDLLHLLREFGEERRLGSPANVVSDSQPIPLASGSFRDGEDFVRAWYISDGKNLVFITYVCEWSVRAQEIAECEEIVRTCRFREQNSDQD